MLEVSTITKHFSQQPFIEPLHREALSYMWRHNERWPTIRTDFETKSTELIEALAFVN